MDSLYKLILSLEQPPQPLQISPTQLLSLAHAVINLLVEQQIAATLWVKLPPGEIWRTEIQHYQQQASGSSQIYICHSPQSKLVAANDIYSEGVTPVIPVPLAAKSQLRREYFLLVVSPQFCSLILAHRPRSRRQTKVKDKAKPRKTPPLITVCSFEGRVVQQGLNGIKQAIAQSAPELVTSHSQLPSTSLNQESSYPQAAPNSLSELLADWDTRFTCPPAPASALIGQVLIKQMQQQAQIQRRFNTRRIATWRQQNQQLHQALSQKDDFLHNLCQELRTPLTHMKAALSLLNSPQLKPQQRQRYVQILNTECDRQNSLINGLLELVQLDRYGKNPVLQPVSLSEIVPGVVSTYQPLAQEKGIMLGYTVATELPPVSCIGPWLKQVVINLLHNSIKFTQTGGQVWVRARVQARHVELEFRDTGVGIPPSEISRVFDRFYRVRPIASEDHSGAGLGLTIVQQILWRCGGSISVKSKPSEGSTFSILLPIAASPHK